MKLLAIPTDTKPISQLETKSDLQNLMKIDFREPWLVSLISYHIHDCSSMSESQYTALSEHECIQKG